LITSRCTADDIAGLSIAVTGALVSARVKTTAMGPVPAGAILFIALPSTVSPPLFFGIKSPKNRSSCFTGLALGALYCRQSASSSSSESFGIMEQTLHLW